MQNVAQDVPTLQELAEARPQRGSGAPARCASHQAAILALLRERGAQGELRGVTDWHYTLLREPDGPQPVGNSRDKVSEKPLPDSPHCFERQTSKPRPLADEKDELLLFAGRL